MNDQAFREFLDALMCFDCSSATALKAYADELSIARGYHDWTDAYHRHEATS